jgi:glycosyltransferase involved in cell wall biosynthesis
MRIIIISPINPYRGGIAHDTANMAKSLAKKHKVTIVSFSLLYPKILYPGNTQKDNSGSDLFKIDESLFLINSINPFSYIKTARYIKRHNPDLLIFQWWNPFFAPAYWSILKILNGKYKVLFMCQNILPHEHFPFQNILTRAVLNKGDFYIVQSPLDEENLKKFVPSADYKRTIVPTYTAFNRGKIDKTMARKMLNINSDVPLLLFFGFIREYKGLKHLIRAMPKIINKIENINLLIVGEVLGKEEYAYFDLISNSGCKDHIAMINKYIPDDDVEQYFSACDLVVLPYESATQSGIVQIAFGFDKPVVVTNVGGLPDAVADGKTGYIVPPCDPDAIAEVVVRFFLNNKADELAANIRESAFKNSWDFRSGLIEELANNQ